ncbi:MAG: asparagine synthase C-terminal domain-containing protein [Acidobacteria bacterium]|nr:asparagine synthase C-terminal domain-containing protein [Acidobacteriota bacterium]
MGSLLSGGVDSSLVCWAIKSLGGNIRAFTVGTPGSDQDETADAVDTARRLEIQHEVLESDSGQSPDVQEIAGAYAEPFGCTSALGMLQISRVVKQCATVLLTGDGGDDVFLGYPSHLNIVRAEALARRLPGVASKLWCSVRGLVPRTGVMRRACHLMDFASCGIGAMAAIHGNLQFFRDNGIMGERLATIESPGAELHWSPASARNLATSLIEYHLQGMFLSEFMTKVDGATMHYALEARSPFLDQELWEFASRLPIVTRLRGNRLKAILRELARRKIGDRVARGAKRGFRIPVEQWMAGRWRSGIEETLRDSLLQKEGWIPAGQALRCLERYASGGRVPTYMWHLYTLESWLRHERAEAIVGTGSA